MKGGPTEALVRALPAWAEQRRDVLAFSSTGSWSLTFTIYGIGLAVAGLLIWIGVRMLQDAARADQPT